MNRVRSACVKTNSSKSCFISLSSDLAEAIGQRIQGQPFALLLQWLNGKAFTSWSGEVIHGKKYESWTGTQSTIEIGRKFADALGLDDNEEVIVEPVVGIPSCNRICVDPVSIDDWEILELHAGYIENQLLHQVRVVFLGQLLPIWIQNHMCVVVKIVDLDPAVDCLRLDEFTEVVVSPKTRSFSPLEDPQQAPFAQGNDHLSSASEEQPLFESALSDQCIGDNDTEVAKANSSCSDTEEHADLAETSLMSRFSVYLQTLLYGHKQSSVDENESHSLADGSTQQLTTVGSSFEVSPKHNDDVVKETEFCMCLRVQPEFTIDNIKSKKTPLSKSLSMRCTSLQHSLSFYSLQPLAVFVDVSSLPPLVYKSWTDNLELLPPGNGTVVKTMQICRLQSPKERSSLSHTSNTKTHDGFSNSDVEASNHSSPVGEETDEESNDVSLHSCIVAMVMTSSDNTIRFEQGFCEVGQAEHVLPGHVIVSKDLCQLLDLKDLSLVKLQSISYGPAEINGIVLQPFENTRLKNISDESLLEAFQEWICSVCSEDIPFVLCSGMLLSLDMPQESHPCQFIVTVLSSQKTPQSSDKLPYYHLTPCRLKNVTVVVGMPCNFPFSPRQGVTTQDKSSQHSKHRITDLGGVTEIFHKCLDHALSALKQRPLANHLGGNLITGLRSGALLICGSSSGAGIGCGKTALAHAVCHQLHQWPVCAHVTVVDCIPFRGKRVETIQKQWQQIFVEAAWHQPSVILFDDLDQIVSAPSALQEMGGEALYKQRLAQVFKELVDMEIENNSRVIVIATSKSCDSLHPSLLTSRGCHVFRCCVELQPPDANQRKEILCKMMKTRFSVEQSCEVELSSLVKKTEGFSLKDLGSLQDRACHKAAMRKMRTSKEREATPDINIEDYDNALEGFTPAALRGVTLHTAGELGWSDVGGLASVKDALMETLLWPTKYSWLFSKSPLRLRSGLLLYGPPGTGKTLLASVVAKECRLNFISIKGPELLSKYIGASEQAVRDMFTRAQSAKPCVLFFDEFDSLAPRRGHDSTGVTDRVVNQLLTQLDGVEGLDSVYVLAATSRPDLIDPALLRPGRLDKCLYCGIPNKSERLQILQALSKPLTLADDTDLDVIVDMCNNFTGADFKALLYNAQLAAIHRSTNSSQLYEGLFSERDSETEVLAEIPGTEQFTRDVIYIPSLTEGIAHPTGEELNKIRCEVVGLKDQLKQNERDRKLGSTTRNVPKHQAASGIKITQSDLLQAASSMGPSVSEIERHRYKSIYETFVKSRGGEFSESLPGQGRATLA